ncbi:MAG: helix-turn-helix domain-containing protein [Turicibacter sp.]|nr:helix-turn-helix domain-containing protein [Turicibacter sp.]
MDFYAGKRVALLRSKLRLTQEELSDVLGIERSEVSRIENAKRPITKEISKKLGKVFNVNPEYFEVIEKDEMLERILNQFRCLLLVGRANEATGLMLKISDQIFHFQQEIEVNFLLATYHFQLHEYGKGNKFVDEFIKPILKKNSFDTIQDEGLKFSYYLYRIEYCAYSRDSVGGNEVCDQLLPCLQDKRQRLSIQLRKNNFLTRAKKYDIAFKHIQAVLPDIEKLQDEVLLARGYLFEGIIYNHLNLHESALKSFDKVESLANEWDFKEQKAMAYQNKGFIYSKMGAYRNALLFNKKAMDLMRDKSRQGPILLSIIKNHLLLKELLDAKLYLSFTEGIEFTENEKMVLLSYRAQLALYAGDLKSHEEMINKAMDYFNNHHNSRALNYVFHFLADYHAEMKNYKKSVEYYRKRGIYHENY